ncbi:MAG: electron transport complex subunit RsxE, partial [Candidatus Marinimicrobia bacterium]|nr:electron transport complex subunit RsxE [Candidatus Neomarinimicrobiota bacterium]
MQEYLKITRNGLWNNNQALVALLGLCPLLAVTNNVANAISLGIATTFVLVASNLSVSLFRNY